MTRADIIGIFVIGVPLAGLFYAWACIITLVQP